MHLGRNLLVFITIINSTASVLPWNETQHLRRHNVSGYQSHLDDIKCPVMCACINDFNYRVICKNRGKDLNHIPYIPVITQSLQFSGNYLPVLNQTTFRTIDFLRILFLDLSNNSICMISTNAFAKLEFIQSLTLSNNIVLSSTIVSNSFNSLSKPDRTGFIFEFDYMDWKHLLSDFFRLLLPTSVSLLYMRNNRIKNINFFTIPTLWKLDLSSNTLPEVPIFCNKEMNAFFPNLINLSLNGNRINICRKNTFICLSKLVSIDLSANPLTMLGDGCLSGLPSIKELYIEEIGRGPQIQKFGLASKTLETFEISGVYVPFTEYANTGIFQFCPGLKILSISGTYVSHDSQILRKLFLPLRNLTKLILRAVQFDEMPVNVFPALPNLSIIDLKENKISFWNGNVVFGNMTSLKVLNLQGNAISVIKESYFTKHLLSGLKSLNLGNNRLACTCDNLWFRNWIRTTSVKLVRYPSWYECKSPDYMFKKNLTIDDYNPKAEDCVENPSFVPIVFSVVFVTIAIIIAFLVYKFRWHLRYRIYLMTRHKYQTIQNEDDFVYLGFVIYSDNDREWVHARLLYHLESKEGLRLCVRLRDFDVGRVIVDNIVENMNISKKIILVLSNNFALSEWCRFELLLAQNRLVNEGSNSLVLVMLEEIASSNLSNPLYALITTTTYYMWSEEESVSSLFWEQVIARMKQ